MRKLIFITTVIIAITASSLSLFAQKIEPEELSFKKTYQMPGMSQEELWRFFRSWTDASLDLTPIGVRYGYEGENYYIHYPIANVNGRPGRILCFISLNFQDNSFEMILSDICVYWGNNAEFDISVRDDKFNRSKLWFLMHNKKAIEIARTKAAEAFDAVVTSMDEYLKTGPEDTFSLTAM